MKDLIFMGIIQVAAIWLILGLLEALITLWEEGEITLGDLVGNILFGAIMMIMRILSNAADLLDKIPNIKIRLPWRKKS